MIPYKLTAFSHPTECGHLWGWPHVLLFENDTMDRLSVFQQSVLLFNRTWQGLTLICWMAFAQVADAQQFPYTAYVTGEQVFVRSGPGQRYYPTGQVAPGYAVEVYRHDGEGWCAIRPIAGSFSWIASHQVRPVEAGIVEVIGEHVVARMGSTLSPNRSAVQVLLPIGERMELMPADKSDDPRWVRVAAPAGEFRWIAASALSRQPPVEVVQQPSSKGWSRQSEQTRKAAEETPSVFGHLDQTRTVAQAGLAFGSPAFRGEAVSLATDPNAMDVVTGSPAEFQLAQFEVHNQAHSQSQTTPQATPQASLAPPALLGSNKTPLATLRAAQPRVRFEGLTPPAPVTVNSIEELELRLSQTVVEPPKEWQLDSLETAANDLLVKTKTLPERAQLREVLERIARFQKVQTQYNSPTVPAPAERDPFETASETAGETTAGATSLSSSVRQRARQDLENDSPRAATDGPLYDATGLLKPVVSKRAEAPQYALLDERGKVVSFVTPTPDLNLKPYIGRRIGVHGKRGFMPEFRRAHVTVARVTPLRGTQRGTLRR